MKNLQIKYFILLLLTLFELGKNAPAQVTVIDSLKKYINTAKADGISVNSLYTLSHHFRDNNFDSTYYYAKAAQSIEAVTIAGSTPQQVIKKTECP